MGRVTTRRPVLRLDGGAQVRRPDTIAVEEPLEIRVGGTPVTVTMRTPGHDFDLAAGFLATEGVGRVRAMTHCAENVVEVALHDGATLPTTAARSFYMTSACGVCGKASADAVRLGSPYDVATDEVRVSSATLAALPERLRAAQPAFDRTGGLHAAGLFDAAGTLQCVREDVGRHNAVDKVVGWAAREDRLPLTASVLLVSGRASFELAQKAVMAGIAVLAAVSAPSSLAVELAEDSGLTLVGFLRGASMNVYAGAHRIVR